MRKIVSTLIVCAFACGVMGALAEENVTVKSPVFNEPGKPILLKNNDDTFSIVLKSNPTTGYSWFLSGFDADLISPKSHRYVPPANNMAGASGYEEWQFNVNQDSLKVPRLSKIEMIYARPWDVASAHPQTFNLVIMPSK